MNEANGNRNLERSRHLAQGALVFAFALEFVVRTASN